MKNVRTANIYMNSREISIVKNATIVVNNVMDLTIINAQYAKITTELIKEFVFIQFALQISKNSKILDVKISQTPGIRKIPTNKYILTKNSKILTLFL